MNYYERHLGDYARDAAHLTMLEHGAYTLLLDRYYTTEAGIPAEQAHRIARARSREEKQAVDTVLAEFFTLENAIWIKGRVQEEISKAQAKIKAAQENGKRGGRPKINPDPSQQKPTGLFLVSENQTQLKAHQTPDTKHQPEITESGNNTANNTAANPDKPTPGEVCIALKKLGLAAVNPGHAKLLVLLDAGAALEEFTGAAADAIAAGKPNFSYILGTVEGRRRDAKATAESIAHGQIKPGSKPWFISVAGIEAKAVELNIEKIRDEHFQDFKVRIYKAAGITPEMVRAANQDHGATA